VFRLVSEAAPLVLGSGSPRRREIVGSLGVSFVVRVGDANEDVRDGESPGAYLERVVLAKLDAVRAAIEPELAACAAGILVADTTVVCDGIMGKPADEEEAYAMIVRLAGRTHEVHTRFAIAAIDGELAHAETVVTRLVFRAISEREARAYAATREGLDKAGGYAIQGRACAFAARIDGSYTCVVGLPACEVSVALATHGLLPR
jgi:septum formation protein